MTATGPMDGFPSEFPFPPSMPTWPEAREDAIAVGKKHTQAMEALERLATQNGGGLLGAAKGLLDEYERRQLITSVDKQRVIAILNAFKDTDRDAGIRRIQEIHQEAVDDPTSKPAALAVSSIAASSVASVTEEVDPSSYAAGYADALGGLFGMGGGPLTMIGMSMTASTLALNVGSL